MHTHIHTYIHIYIYIQYTYVYVQIYCICIARNEETNGLPKPNPAASGSRASSPQLLQRWPQHQHPWRMGVRERLRKWICRVFMTAKFTRSDDVWRLHWCFKSFRSYGNQQKFETHRILSCPKIHNSYIHVSPVLPNSHIVCWTTTRPLRTFRCIFTCQNMLIQVLHTNQKLPARATTHKQTSTQTETKRAIATLIKDIRGLVFSFVFLEVGLSLKKIRKFPSTCCPKDASLTSCYQIVQVNFEAQQKVRSQDLLMGKFMHKLG